MDQAIVAAGRTVGKASFKERVRKAAQGFTSIGIGRGDCVAILMRNDLAFLEATLAAQSVGAYAVPVNWHFTPDEILYVVDDCAPRLLVGHSDLLASITGRLSPKTRALTVPTPTSIADAYRVPADRCALPPDAAVWDDWLNAFEPASGEQPAATDSLIYTSGTTGKPKGVRRQPADPALAPINEKMRAQVYGIGEGARVMVAAPLYHTAPNFFALRAVRLGDVLVLAERFDPETFLADIERHRITHIYAVPTMFVRLLELDDAIRSRFDLSSLEFVLHAGGPCPAAVKLKMIEWLGPVLCEYYGSTEHGPITFCTSHDWLTHKGTVGRPVTGVTLEIHDEDGNALPRRQVGEIVARNSAHPDFTYHNLPEERAKLQQGDLIRSGDVGYLDPDGFLYLCDRKRDMIISGGVNIYPAEIEATLAECTGVRDSAVFGLPDDTYGEKVMAVVQPMPGVPIEPERIREFLKGRLASYKIPRHIEIVHDLPREESGKIRKRLIRDRYLSHQ